MTATHQRIVTSELLNELDPLEQIIARLFINEGRWKIEEDDN
jgi:hypothetical protein